MIVAMIISGSIGLFVVKSGQSPENIVYFRCAIAFICLLPVIIFSGQLKKAYFTPKKLAMMVGSGWLLIFNWILLFKAFPLTSISLATIVYHVNPFIILLLGVLIFKEKFTPSDGFWIGLGFIGLVIIIGIHQTSLSQQELVGLGLVLIATSLYSGSVLITKKLSGTPPLLIVLVQTFAGALITYPLTTSLAQSVTFDQWQFILPLGVVHTAFLYGLIYSAIAKLQLSVIAILSFIYPISTVVFDYIFFDHVISLRQAIGASLILIATVGVKLHWKFHFGFRNNS
ncbi:EamA family transporter [Limnohabitans sp. T6-5]|nr:EamA family transporter [Limnohabitans sp. T6-5]